jgi:hypothetical protein
VMMFIHCSTDSPGPRHGFQMCSLWSAVWCFQDIDWPLLYSASRHTAGIL